jgi:hypothetical protein
MVAVGVYPPDVDNKGSETPEGDVQQMDRMGFIGNIVSRLNPLGRSL